MTKTLIEIDDEYLAAAQQALGTATKRRSTGQRLSLSARSPRWQPGGVICKGSPPAVCPTLKTRT